MSVTSLTYNPFAFTKIVKPFASFICWMLLLGGIVSCDSGDVGLCFDDNTPIAERMVDVAPFATIVTGQNVALVLSQGDQSIRVVAPESFIDEVSVVVANGMLRLEDENRCDLFRESAPTTIYVTAPEISRIRNASQYEVRSDGLLSYESLTLVSDENEGARYSVGEFQMEIAVQTFEVISNNLSNFYISGTAENALIGLYSGSGRFEGRDFLVDDLRVFHRGSNTMSVHPLNSIRGELRSNGDVIAVHRSEIVEVAELDQGRLVFE